MKTIKGLLLIIPLMFYSISFAGEADIINVDVKKTGTNTYQFNVTVSHNDEGWDHYVNKWEVVGPDGTLIATRILHHPHVNEQPFTRSLSNVTIPEGIKEVTLRAYDSVHKYGGKVITIPLP